MMQLAARDVLHWPHDKIWGLNDVKEISMTFDDGETHRVTGRGTILSHMYWSFHRHFPKMPLNSSDHILDRRFNNGLHRKMLGKGLWDAFDGGFSADLDQLCRIAMETFNAIYNDCTYNLGAYVTTIQLSDYIQLLDHPEIKKAREEAVPSEGGVERVYSRVKAVLLNDPALEGNSIVDAVRSQLISIGQVLQSIAVRGYVTDYDSVIFRKPIMKGYIDGFTKLVEHMKESRSGSKALMVTKDPLQKTEFFGRKIQLSTAAVATITPGDCGSTETVSFQVTKEALGALEGRYHIVKGKLELITKDSKELVGKVVQLRSPQTCKHRTRLAPCETCLGTLSLSIPTPHRFNGITACLGHVAAVNLCSPVSQKVLSTKHEDGSSTAEELHIPSTSAKFINLAADRSKIRLDKSLKTQKAKLIVSAQYIKHLPDINTEDNVEILSTTTLAKIGKVFIERSVVSAINKKENVYLEEIATSVGPRLANFTYDFLNHIKAKGWELNPSGDYVFDLSGWNFQKPVLMLPQQHLSMLEFMTGIQNFLELDKPDSLKRIQDPSTALRHFYNRVSSHASVHTMHLEVILLSCMVSSTLYKDARPPAMGQPVYYDTHKALVFNRSVSAALALGWHTMTLLTPGAFIYKNRVPHQLDPLIR